MLATEPLAILPKALFDATGSPAAILLGMTWRTVFRLVSSFWRIRSHEKAKRPSGSSRFPDLPADLVRAHGKPGPADHAGHVAPIVQPNERNALLLRANSPHRMIGAATAMATDAVAADHEPL